MSTCRYNVDMTYTDRIPACRVVDGDRVFRFTEDEPGRVVSYDKNHPDIVVLTIRTASGDVVDEFYPPNAKLTVVRRPR